MKYYIVMVVTMALLTFGLFIKASSEVNKIQMARNEYIASRYSQVVVERNRAVSGLFEIQDRINSVREALK